MKKAFTLIELLVVIAIIAILAAILFPVFAQAKTAAKKTADLSNMKQLGLGVKMYLTDNDDRYFAYRFASSTITDGYAVLDKTSTNKTCLTGTGTASESGCYYYINHHFWNQIIAPYVKNDQIYKDPAYGSAWVNSNPANPLGDGYGGNNSYGINSFFCDTNSKNWGINESSVAAEADTIFLGNEDYYHSLPSTRDRTGTPVIGLLPLGDANQYDWAANGYADQWINNGKGCDWDSSVNLSTAAGMTQCLKDQQLFGNIFNVTWADGHAKSVAIDKYTYDWVDNAAKGTSIWDPYKAGGK